MPAVKGLTDLGRRLTPVGYVEGVRKKFIYAGQGSPDAVDRFLAIRVVTVALAVVGRPADLAVLGSHGQHPPGRRPPVHARAAPRARRLAEPRVEARQLDIRRRLPDVLDLLTISVEAGLGFEQALDRTVAAVPGPLSDEFSRMLGEVRAGSSRSQAMRALEARSNVMELRSFVLAILQADTFGVSIGRVLRAQADEMRIRRRQLAQEMAQKAPVKMLIPMVFCIFPALFAVVLGPAMINIYRNLLTEAAARPPRVPSTSGRLLLLAAGVTALAGVGALVDNSFLTHLATGRIIWAGTGARATRTRSRPPARPGWSRAGWRRCSTAALERLGGLGGIRVLMAATTAALGALTWTLTRPAVAPHRPPPGVRPGPSWPASAPGRSGRCCWACSPWAPPCWPPRSRLDPAGSSRSAGCG